MDECPNEADRRILTQALAKCFSNLPPFIRIMVVSRPEPDIQQALECHPSGKSKKFLVGLVTTCSDLVNILSKIKQNSDKEEPTCHK
jgi:hypothetical protein